MIQKIRALLPAIICCLILATPCAAQIRHDLGPFTATQWTTRHGLPSNVIRGLAQDDEGYLWIATFSGLARFDGMRFETFDLTNTPQFRNSQFNEVITDDQGIVCANLIGHGAFLHQDGSFTRLPGLEPEEVTQLGKNASGEILVGTVEGLFRYRDGTLNTFFQPGAIHSFLSDRSGRLWVLLGPTISGGQFEIVCLENGTERLREKLTTGPKSIGDWMQISPWKADGVIVHLKDTLVFANPEGIRTVPLVQAITPGLLAIGRTPHGEWNPHCLLEDLEGATWLGSESGLFRAAGAPFDQQASHEVAVSTILPAAMTGVVNTLFLDRRGALWVGTEEGGLFHILPAITSPLAETPGVDVPLKFALKCHNMPWFMEETEGARDDEYILRNLSGSEVVPITESGKCALILSNLATSGAVLRFGESYFIYSNGELNKLPAGSADLPAPLLKKLPGGEFWYVTEDAVLCATSAGSDRIPISGSFLSRTLDGAWWFMDGDRLHRYAVGSHASFGSDDGLPRGKIRCLWQDPLGRLWLAFQGSGMACLVDGRFRVATVRNGLPENTVGGMLADDQGRLWVNSNRGLFVVRQDALNRFADGETDRLNCRKVTSVESGSHWCVRGQDGRLYFHTLEGLVSVEPEKLPPANSPPPARILKVRYRNRELAGSGKLLLPRGERNFSITFTAPDLHHADQVRFRYRMKNQSEAWADSGTRREAFFTHIPPGIHLFEVVASNAAGEWAVTGDTILIQIPAFYYETLWFRVLAVLATMALLYSIHRIRLRSKERTLRIIEAESSKRLEAETSLRRMGRRLLQTQEEERRRIARELHDDVNQRLAALAMELDMMEGGIGREPGELALDVQTLSADVHKISHSLHPARLEQLGLVKALQVLCEDSSRARARTITCETHEVPGVIPAQLALCLFRIAQEAIRNAVKYSGSDRIRVSLTSVAGELVLEVADQGRGFDTRNPDLEGLGLISMAERVGAAGGRLQVESNVGEGTTIRAAIPLPEGE